MFHQLVLRYFSVVNYKIFHIDSEILMTIITFTISLAVSHYSFILFETPMNSYIKRILKKSKTTPNRVDGSSLVSDDGRLSHHRT